MTRYKYFLPLIIFLPVSILQLTIIPLISIGSIHPDLILIIVVYYALKHGQIYGTVLGFALGFLFDITSGGLLGSSMFSKTFAGFIAGYFYNEVKTDYILNSLNFNLIVFLCAVADSFLRGLINIGLMNTRLTFLLVELALLPGLYTALISVPLMIFGKKEKLS